MISFMMGWAHGDAPQIIKISWFCIYLNIALTLAGCLLSIVQLLKNPHSKRWAIYLLVCIGALLSGIINGEVVYRLLERTTYRLDLYAFAFDRMFGEPSFVLGRLLANWPLLNMAQALDYRLIYPSMLLLLSWYFITQSYQEAIGVAKAFVLSQVLVLVYLIVPVSGPKYAFPTFPVSVPSVSPHPIYLRAVPNGVPCGHFLIALLVLYFARRCWLGRVLGTINLVLTGIATLGSGEHYAFDLLAAIPFAMFLLYVSDDAFTIRCHTLLRTRIRYGKQTRFAEEEVR